MPVITVRLFISPAHATEEVGRLIASEDPATTWRSEAAILSLEREVRGLHLVGSTPRAEKFAQEWLDRAQKRVDHAAVLDAYSDDDAGDGAAIAATRAERIRAVVAHQAGVYADALRAACEHRTVLSDAVRAEKMLSGPQAGHAHRVAQDGAR